METPEDMTQTFQQYRALLFAIAYRMLGSVTDAEDIVQETFLRWLQTKQDEVQSPRAYLSTIVTRLCIDLARSARAQREVYVGPWLPEPLLTGQHAEFTENALMAESLSFAFLIMLENLNPLERAVFLLREVFEYDYSEIASIISKSETNCRQIFHRAHQHLGQRRSRFDVSHEQQEHITSQFMRASASGDMQGLLNLLTEDIAFTGDGGGKARAGLKPVHGPEKVARGILSGLKLISSPLQAHITEINGQPGIVAYVDRRPYMVVLLEFAGERICNVYTIVNPDKLRAITYNTTTNGI